MTMTETFQTGIERVVTLAGSQTALARILGVTPQAVQKWVAQGLVPHEHCRAIEIRWADKVTRHELNPVVFGSREEALALLTRGELMNERPDAAQGDLWRQGREPG